MGYFAASMGGLQGVADPSWITCLQKPCLIQEGRAKPLRNHRVQRQAQRKVQLVAPKEQTISSHLALMRMRGYVRLCARARDRVRGCWCAYACECL
eukprot:6174674-Pleurochrysis_carterae.AAC.1